MHRDATLPCKQRLPVRLRPPPLSPASFGRRKLGGPMSTTCERCGNNLSRAQQHEGNRFCSHACANRRGRKPETERCECGRKRSTKSMRCNFCNAKTQAKVRRDRLTEDWLSGNLSGGSWRGVSGYVRAWLVSTSGEQCAQCGWGERHPTTGKVPVQVDHIDGNPLSHRPENLRLLCPNCHSLTPHFGALNRGHGRTQRYRRSRPEEGRLIGIEETSVRF